jgi:hypothetical protein
MKKVDCYCLFDITATGVSSNRPSGPDPAVNLARNQQRNWDTMTQLAGMRTQIFNIDPPQRIEGKESPFGDDCTAWKFSFEIEPEAQWTVDGDEFWVLKHDSDGTPMITGLTETPGLEPLIQTLGDHPNVIYTSGK